jgi:hypothetical protein
MSKMATTGGSNDNNSNDKRKYENPTTSGKDTNVVTKNPEEKADKNREKTKGKQAKQETIKGKYDIAYLFEASSSNDDIYNSKKHKDAEDNIRVTNINKIKNPEKDNKKGQKNGTRRKSWKSTTMTH